MSLAQCVQVQIRLMDMAERTVQDQGNLSDGVWVLLARAEAYLYLSINSTFDLNRAFLGRQEHVRGTFSSMFLPHSLYLQSLQL